jgi:hypothetical protein
MKEKTQKKKSEPNQALQTTSRSCPLADGFGRILVGRCFVRLVSDF